MIVHLIAHLETAHSEVETLRRIMNVVYGRGHSLSENWIEPQYYRHANLAARENKPEWDIICREAAEKIKNSDVLIAEASGYSSFGVGYQVSIGQHCKKPILLLTKYTPPYGAYIDGLNYGTMTRQEYNDKNLEIKVDEFLKRHEG